MRPNLHLVSPQLWTRDQREAYNKKTPAGHSRRRGLGLLPGFVLADPPTARPRRRRVPLRRRLVEPG